MTRPKAQFNRPASEQNIVLASQPAPQFSAQLVERLHALCPLDIDAIDGAVPPEDHLDERDADAEVPERTLNFAQALLTVAHWARAALNDWQRALTKQDILAELDALSAQTSGLRERLATVSRDVSVHLENDPRDVADALGLFLRDLARARDSASQMPGRLSAARYRSWVAQEFTIRVLRVCQRYGMPITATARNMGKNSSKAVKVLEFVGGAAGLPRSEFTWRDLISAARAAAPDLVE
ncbi:MAG: hypothetical protein IV093_15140 [Rubrivivax sp.]|nr:hypothetical protein [Rubrivivax sp.]